MSHRLGRRDVLGGAGLVLAAPAIVRAQGQGAGVALVIGNSKYQWEAPLPNVRRDAPDMAQRFQAMGLRTELIQDAGGQAMRQAINKLKADAQGARFAAFYFAGHGVAARRDNYIVPLDADLSSAKMDALIPTSMVFGALRSAANRMMVFDACRNNPADGAMQLETERTASMNQEASQQRIAENPNTLSLFSTSPGHVALDGPAGENSPFAAALLRQLSVPQIDLYTMAPKLRRDLLIATEGRQMLWDLNGYTQPFVLPGPRQAAAGRSGAGDAARAMELPQAYAFAQQSGFFVPAGLVAYRAPSSSPDARKIGSFRFEARQASGQVRPQLFIVLSVTDKRALVLQAGINESVFWSLRLANVSGHKLDLVPRAGAPRFTFDFSDGNTGTVTLVPEGGAGGPPGGGPGGPQGGGRPGGGMGPQQRGPQGGMAPGGSGGGGGRPGSTGQFTRLD
jgi:hypothetical protein